MVKKVQMEVRVDILGYANPELNLTIGCRFQVNRGAIDHLSSVYPVPNRTMLFRTIAPFKWI